MTKFVASERSKLEPNKQTRSNIRELLMDLSAVNWMAVVVAAALPGFIVGYVWYGPLLGKAWMRESGMTEEKIAQGNMGRTFGVALLLQLIIASFLAMFFFSDPASAELINAGSGAFYGFLTGFGWAAMAIGVNALFEQKSFMYIAINGSYWVIVFTLMGLILGAWR